MTLKTISKIRIGHDGKNAGAGWFLDKVIVKQEGSDKYTQVFNCNRWLAVDEDDGLIIREITAGEIVYNIKDPADKNHGRTATRFL